MYSLLYSSVTRTSVNNVLADLFMLYISAQGFPTHTHYPGLKLQTLIKTSWHKNIIFFATKVGYKLTG